MPRTTTEITTVDGALRSVSLARTGDGKISITIVVLETHSKDGVPIASRERSFTQDDLTQAQRDNLLLLFNALETRIQTNFYT